MSGTELTCAATQNTFNQFTGGADFEVCIACPPSSGTDGPAKTHPTDCICFDTHYSVFEEAEQLVTCMACPVGGILLSAFVCSLRCAVLI